MSQPLAAFSELCEIRPTPSTGRAVFARQRIPRGTPLLTSGSPSTWVVYRKYRREVCAECFAYNRGVQWKLRDAANGTGTGAVWCSEACKHAWARRWNHTPSAEVAHGREKSLAAGALTAVERLVSSARAWNDGEWDVAMLDAAAAKPTEVEVRQAWEEAKKSEQAIRAARIALENNIKGSKVHKKVMQVALAEPPAPDILSYLLSAALVSYSHPEQWEQLLRLEATPEPYPSHSRLNQHILAFYQLLAILPVQLLEHVTPEVCLAASDREAHNSFGLRSLDDDGCEMFGFGVWPSASYWNHSCAPNVRKGRVGRDWCFETDLDVEEGEQLCITYLGGEEKELGLEERRRRLKETWAFTCMCSGCIQEEKRIGERK